MLRTSLLLSLLSSAALASADTPTPGPDAGPPKDYTLVVTPPPAGSVGAPAELVIAITPKSPWVLKVETPFSATLSASPAVTLEKTRLDTKDFVDPKAETKTVLARFTPQSAGEHTISADLSFFLCTDTICKRLKDTTQTKVVAQ